MTNTQQTSESTTNNKNKVIETTVNTVMGVKNSDLSQENSPLDTQKILSYIFGTAFQIGAMILTLWLINIAFNNLDTQNYPHWLITTVVCIFLTFITIRSRLFSPLDNTRSRKQYDSVKRPLWAPPPLAFPIVWMTIGVLRVISSYLVWSTLDGNFLALPLIAYIIHLALGDTWNTIFTVEGRFGLAIPVVICGPLLSSFVVTFLYWQTVSIAGWVLFPSCLWLTVASVLVFSIWQLNKQPM